MLADISLGPLLTSKITQYDRFACQVINPPQVGQDFSTWKFRPIVVNTNLNVTRYHGKKTRVI